MTFWLLASFAVDFCGTSCNCLVARFLFLPATSVEVDSADLGGLPRRLPGLPAEIVLVLTMDDLVLGLTVAGFLAGAEDWADLP